MAEIYSGAVDKGLEGVVACTTGISSIVDATLCYRGYTIEDLAAHSSFEETVFLLWENRLPKANELEAFKRTLADNMALSAPQVEQLKALPTSNVHPMAWLRTAVSMLALWDPESQSTDPTAQRRVAVRLTAKMGSLVTLFDRNRNGKSYVTPKPERNLAWNFLYQLKGEEPDAEIAKNFDTCLILHADHELNCSAFAARVTASSLSDIYSAVTSAVAALKGPLHGGANEQVMLMLKEIGSAAAVRGWIKQALTEKKKIMGFGHRVYKNGDPRAKILSQLSQRLTAKTGQAHWYEMSKDIDDVMQNDKGLLPNVDFYSATVYYAMGIPIDIYTPIFAVSRVSGWLAHVFEQYSKNRIYRPRGEWIGKEGLKWTPPAQR
ncbi:MAG: citrate/2-methylcitrate synthase [Bdellovibrionales bacterium]